MNTQVDARRDATRLEPRVLVAIAAGSLTVFGVLLVSVWHVSGATGLDDVLGGTWGGPSNSTALHATAWLGSPPFVFAGVLAVGTVAFAARLRGTMLLCLVGPALAGLCELLAKPVVDRLNDGSLSYPSGHATLAAALATLIVIVAHQLGGRKTALAAAPSAALPLIVSVAVVRLGWHYPTDVIGGIGLGVGVVCAAAAAVVALEAAARTNRKKTVRTS